MHGWLSTASILLAVGVSKSAGAGMKSLLIGIGIHVIEYIPMEPKKLGFLLAILFFLISFLINLLQRRYSRKRLDRIFRKDESVFNFLEEINNNLGKLEVNCTFEVHGESSPQEVGKEIHVVRGKIQSTIDNLEEHLSSFRQYRGKEKPQGKKKKQLGKSQKIVYGR
jgi:hypothetical protein